ncbi:DUF6115 domain-containing protein [Inediibacterium massiliense]|uniref:DUF6115 domain-containing protein n=1 Tax=Inediibacterium massiliense TaxID=1658111 RepID=UPI0006B69E33|nr:hypothetical protein [Inediibacterium massiliense]
MIDYILFFIGIGIMIVSFIWIKKSKKEEEQFYKNIESKENQLLKDIHLAQNIMNELEGIHENIVLDLEKKTKDLYDILKNIDENMGNKTLKIDESNKYDKESQSHIEEKDATEIFMLIKKGYTPSQIAKKLNKGIGEVQLICNLNKIEE